MIAAHPQAPIVTLHHFDNIDPIFPNRNRTEAVKHLMKAAEVDQSRLAQQTICYDKPMNWSVSVSWGYSVHIYESMIPRSILKKPLETFKPWKNGPRPLYMFNTRLVTNNPCHTPHTFFMEYVRKLKGNSVVLTTYRRNARRRLQPCFVSGNYSAENILRVRVFSNATVRKEVLILGSEQHKLALHFIHIDDYEFGFSGRENRVLQCAAYSWHEFNEHQVKEL